MRVALDFDNTLSDTTGVLCALTNFKEGTHITPADITRWNYWQEQGLEETFWAIYTLMDETNLRKACPPVSPFAPAVTKWLLKRGHTVDVVTANKPEAYPSIYGWLWAHGIECRVRTLGRVSPGSKARLKYDLIIDDSPTLIEPMRRMPSKRLILLTQPWNASIDVSHIKNVIRAKDWLDIMRILEGMGL